MIDLSYILSRKSGQVIRLETLEQPNYRIAMLVILFANPKLQVISFY